MKEVTQPQNYSSLITELASLIEQGRKTAVRYVNTALVATYWLAGRRIVEYEQKGEKRAEYGEELLKNISADLTPQFGKGFTERNLWHMRQFYITYKEILHTVCAELPEKTKKKKLNDTQIKVNGIEVLNETLGPADALRFLTLLNQNPIDYVQISRKLYAGQSIKEIFSRAKKNWEG